MFAAKKKISILSHLTFTTSVMFVEPLDRRRKCRYQTNLTPFFFLNCCPSHSNTGVGLLL